MVKKGELWAVLLAAGDGRRVRSLTAAPDGVPVPKQYWRLDGGEPMLRWAIRRSARLVPRDRLVVIVASQHLRWWARELLDLPRANVVVQPENRGTAAGILLPLLHVLERDPDARVIVMPTDHHVASEDVLREAMEGAVDAAGRDRGRIVLVGVTPREPDSECGWIVCGGPSPGAAARPVDSFVEKPERDRAESLMRQGAVLNTMIFAAAGSALMELYARAAPGLLERFAAWRASAPTARATLKSLYRTLPSLDFSRDILEGSSEMLSVVSAAECGWCDLGTPAKLERYREEEQVLVRTA